jgi:universal stress protein A
MKMTSNILVPTDFSEFSNKALDEAVALASEQNAHIHLLHVVDNGHHRLPDFDYGKADTIFQGLDAGSLKESQAMMEKQLGGFAEEQRARIIPMIESGSPSDVILREQKGKDIDLIMMGSHGSKGFLSGLLGDVAYRVVKHAPCSVMVVRQ